MTGLAPIPAASAGLGLAAAIVGFLMLPIGDALGKYLAEGDLPVLQIVWGRWVSQTLLLTPVVLYLHRRRAFRVDALGLQVVRALMLVFATLCFFSAVRIMPLADATAVLFVAPLIVVALSALLLGERVGPRRWAAVVIGFIGVLMIMRPGPETLRLGALFALGAALCFSFYMVLTRKAAGRAPPILALWWMGLVGVTVMTAAAAPVWRAPTMHEWQMMGLIGLVMAPGHLLVIWAADRVEASAMAVTPYLEMVTSTILGLLIFGDFPDVLTWSGCALVVGCGLFVAWRERRAVQPVRVAG